MPDSSLNSALATRSASPAVPQLFSAQPASGNPAAAPDASFSRALERRMEGAERRSTTGTKSSAPERPKQQPSAPERAQAATAAGPERPSGKAENRPATAQDASSAAAEVPDEDKPAEQDAAPEDAAAASLAAFLPQVAAPAAELAGEAAADTLAAEDVTNDGGRRGKPLLPDLAGGETAAEDAASLDPAQATTGTSALQKLLSEAAERAQAGARRDAPAAEPESAAAKPAKPETSSTVDLAAVTQTRPTAGASEANGAANHQVAPAAHLPAAVQEARAESAKSTQLPVSTPVGQRAWAEDVGSKVMWVVGRGESKAELILTPPHLGKLEVSINMNGDQSTAHFVAASSAARDALEQAMPRLRELLQQAGINLGEANVSTSGEHAAGQEAFGRRGASTGSGKGESGEGDAVTTASAASGWTRLGRGLVDTFA